LRQIGELDLGFSEVLVDKFESMGVCEHF